MGKEIEKRRRRERDERERKTYPQKYIPCNVYLEL